MSVMLEALRKAERRARPGAAGAEPMVRESVAPLSASSHGELSLEPAPEPTLPGPSPETATAPGMQAAEAEAAATAQQGTGVSRETDGRSRRSFVLVLGLLGVLALGSIAYFWLLLLPKPPVVHAKPASPIESLGVAPKASSLTDDAIPGLPPPVASRTIEPEQAVPRATALSTASAQVMAAPAADSRSQSVPAMQARPAQDRGEVARIHGQVESGYAAYQAGELGIARAAYEQALLDEPRNRDALLGLAAVEIRTLRFDRAEALYENLLQMSPRDPHALAGLTALRAERADPLQAESSLKTLLAADPDATLLQFSLGNQFARQARWAEAQQAYSRALTSDPDNPDAAFNLAVSHDRLRQSAAAQEQYERALRLAERRVASFSPEAVRLRLLQLSN